MTPLTVRVACEVVRTFRVDQIAGLFDVPLEAKTGREFNVELPAAGGDWQIGAIVGPSGSGKSSVAREAYGRALYTGGKWPAGKSVLDGFPDSLSIKEITATLTAVGFSTPPAWVRPYAVLSNGERFRCDLARALLTGGDLVAFDEFTSVVDRTVAKVGSAAVAKAIRSGRIAKRFVAVTCHYDVLDWLTPDWVLDMETCQLARGSLRRRPPIELEIYKAERAAWQLFAPHHYLNPAIPNVCSLWLAAWNGRPVAAVVCGGHFGRSNGPKKIIRVSRLVVLPDYQGVGIGGAVLNAVAGRYVADGRRVRITSGHPAMFTFLQRSPAWRLDTIKPHGRPTRTVSAATALAHRTGNADGVNPFARTSSAGRAVVSAEYIGPAVAAG